jgi:copper transport protein
MTTATRTGSRIGLAVLVLLALALPLYAHTQLERSVPAADTVVPPPPLLRLTFNEAVDPAVAELRLLGSDSLPRALGEVVRGETARELAASVLESLPTGLYTVVWQVVGADGHPVRGRYSFAVNAPGTEAIGAGEDTAGSRGAVGQAAPVEYAEDDVFGVESPGFVAARWITFAAMLSVIGAVAFRFLVLAPTRARNPALAEALREASLGAAALGRGAAVFLILAAGVRLLLQMEALGGGDLQLARDLLLATSWGSAWFLQVGGAAIAAIGCHFALRGRAAGWTVAAGAAVAIALSASLASHAAAADLAALAVTADTVHVLAVAGWLGALLVLVVVGIPAVLREDPRTGRFSAVAALIGVFSPRALAMAGIVVATGTVGALLHLGSVGALWQTGYGRALLLKVLLFLLVVAVGAYNWRRMKPRLDRGDSPEGMRRTATVELLLAAVVLLVTAVLVALPTP